MLIFLRKYCFYVVTRIVRMFPGMLLTIMFFAGPATLFASGPLAPTYAPYAEACRQRWWWDLSFVNNFLMRHSYFQGETKSGCIGNAWYVAVDFQIYLVMPFLLLPLKLTKYKQTYLWLLTAVSCVIPAAIVMANDLWPNYLLTTQDNGQGNAYTYHVYAFPWTRATPYCVGALVAYWLSLLERGQKSGRELMNEFHKNHPRIATLRPRLLGWAASTAVALAVVLGLADSSYIHVYSAGVPPPHVLSPAETFFYAALAILAWSAAVAWVVLQCAAGLAEPLNAFLSHPMWQPLSRLTFGAYLISYPLQMLLSATFQEYIYVNWNMVLILWMGVIWLSYAASLALSLLAEAPVINLLKLLR